jgi:ATP-dependent DNA helicase PIF1
MESMERHGKEVFVDGYCRTGKAYLRKAITIKLHSEGKIVLAAASCGIATLFLQGGRTAHSRFHIPLILTEESICDIRQGTHLAELLKKTLLILWVKAPIANKICFQALDKTQRDILRNKNEKSSERPFGGMTVVLGEDFCQIPPVLPKGRRHNIVTSSIKRSYFWKHFHIMKLTYNMRINSMTDDIIEKQRAAESADWIFNIGDGNNKSAEREEMIKIPSGILLEKGNAPKKANCGKHLHKFEGEVPVMRILRRKSNLISKE